MTTFIPLLSWVGIIGLSLVSPSRATRLLYFNT